MTEILSHWSVTLQHDQPHHASQLCLVLRILLLGTLRTFIDTTHAPSLLLQDSIYDSYPIINHSSVFVFAMSCLEES